jgi:hypothetical protein
MLADEYFEDMDLPIKEPVSSVTQPSTPTNVPQQQTNKEIKTPGRPLLTKDTQKRKQKRVLPKTGEASTALLWGIEAQNQIADILNPVALKHFNKPNVRSLNKDELNQLDNLKLRVFSNMEIFESVNEDTVKTIIDNKQTVPTQCMAEINKQIKAFNTRNNRQPTTNELKFIYASALCEYGKNDE